MKAFLLIVGALAIIGGVGYFVYQQNEPDTAQNSSTSSTPTQSAETETTNAQKPQASTSTVGSYETYSAEKLASAGTGSVVLFFNASWCPDCRATVKDIEANLNEIPADLTILSVDYDKYADLKKQYGVTYQHTFVQVDENGKQLKKWSGSFTLDDIEAQVE